MLQAMTVLAGGGDTTVSGTVPLVTSNVTASSIGYHSSTISWKTNGDATSQVFYDTEFHENTADYSDRTDEDSNLVSEHSVSLSSLSSSTTYHYRVRSAIPETEFIAISDDYTFRTLTSAGGGGGIAPATTPPVISIISVFNITKTSTDITWKTNKMSDSQVEYWSSPSKLSPLDKTMVVNHLVHLTDLMPGTTYHYKTMSRNAAGNLAVSGENTFTTPPGVAAFAANKLSISPSEVDIGEPVTITMLIINAGDGAGSYTVTIKINGLVEATEDVILNVGASKEVTFSTTKDAAGTYSVEVDGLRDSFTVKKKPAPAPVTQTPAVSSPVKPPINWPLIGGIIAAVVGLLVFFLVRRRAA